MLLKDKICVIAGAASVRSIGFAVAELFAEHGCSVAAADIRMDDRAAQTVKTSIETKLGRAADIMGVRCDISKPAECQNLFQQVLTRHGRIDCLVNCAGIVQSGPFQSIAEADYDRMMEINLKGAFNLCQAALGIFSKRGTGVIVNVASVAAQRGGGLVGAAHYAASKGGVISLTRAIAREFGPQGIRANIVCPSMTETGMLDGSVSEQQRTAIKAGIPLQRLAQARDIAGACLFLASDLSAYVTGATIDVNGGSHIH